MERHNQLKISASIKHSRCLRYLAGPGGWEDSLGKTISLSPQAWAGWVQPPPLWGEGIWSDAAPESQTLHAEYLASRLSRTQR